MYLIDTNVISVGAPSGQTTSAMLIDWMDWNSDRLYLSVITIAEIEEGIAKSCRRGATKKAASLSEWLDAVLHLYTDRILSLDIGVARLLGVLSEAARSGGHAPGLADLAIAATAQAHGLTILTRNVRHFAPLGLAAIDPFQALPD